LKDDGELLIGIIDKDSFLGKYYQKKKSIFYKEAHFFNVSELESLLKKAGFGNFMYYQALFKPTDMMNSVDTPQKGCGKGGFVAVRAEAKKGFLNDRKH